ncbi:MAG: GNAT family N-acetyltransferase [Wenzhouxiangellaceae bacterium]|nr:GNAT family N-acetyltransferase [Wenzhouxiangellaceae bacterium]
MGIPGVSGNAPCKRPPRRARFTRIRLGRPWCEALELDNGRLLVMRRIEPRDAPVLRRSFGYLTPEEIRFRFLHPINELTPDYARSLSHIDRNRAFALVIVEALPPEQALIGAVARATIDDTGARAEFAIVVGREISGFGLGTLLMRRLIEWCRKKRLDTIYGVVMIENERMLALARSLGFRVALEPDNPGTARIWLPLRAAGRDEASNEHNQGGKDMPDSAPDRFLYRR